MRSLLSSELMFTIAVHRSLAGSFLPLLLLLCRLLLLELCSGGPLLRLELRLGVPILSLAKAGGETRYMLGVKERQLLARHLRDGCPTGGM